jgi:hypothetical protein
LTSSESQVPIMVTYRYIMQNSPPKQKNQITQTNITGRRRTYTEARYDLSTLISYTKFRSFAINISMKSVSWTQCSSVTQTTRKCRITMQPSPDNEGSCNFCHNDLTASYTTLILSVYLSRNCFTPVWSSCCITKEYVGITIFCVMVLKMTTKYQEHVPQYSNQKQSYLPSKQSYTTSALLRFYLYTKNSLQSRQTVHISHVFVAAQFVPRQVLL